MIKNFALVALGGGLGSILRYSCQKLFQLNFSGTFPLGTFLVNISGSILIGLLWGLSIRSAALTENWKLVLMTGLCGGFTTFSAFSQESISLLRDGKTNLFFLYVLGSVVLGLLATFYSFRLTQ
jgi:CrcB protein